MPVISTPGDVVGPREGSCRLTVCGQGRMSAFANLPSLPVTAVIFSLAAAVHTVTFAPATGSPAAVRTTPVHAGADGALCVLQARPRPSVPTANTFLPVGRPYERFELLRAPPLRSGIYA